MKKILILISALLVLANIAKAQTVADDLIGLGMRPELAEYVAATIPAGTVLSNAAWFKARNQANSADINMLSVDATDDTVLNADAGDVIKLAIAGTTEITIDNDSLTFAGATTSTLNTGASTIIKPVGDANRAFTLAAASDAAHTITFGDAGTTATQTLLLSASTPDTDDDSTVSLSGGGAAAATRGAFVTLQGTDVGGAGAGGAFGVTTGDNGSITATASGTGTVILKTGSTTKWVLENDGDLVGDATNGGNLIFAKPLAGVIQAVGTLAAAGSVQGDAAAIVSYLTTITAADATKGVILPATPVTGATYTILNTANAVLKIYPGSGDQISALGANANMSAAAYTVVYCHAVSASQWWCAEPAVAG